MASTQARERIIEKMTQAPQSQHAFALAPGALAPIVIADGALEALKWLGIVLMTIDHINKYLNGGHSALMFDMGRIALPLFGFVLAYNLCRPGALTNGAFKRVSTRLFVWGCIATIPFVAIHGSNDYGWPLNILFTLLVSTLVIWLLELRNPKLMIAILPLFSFASMLPEFWHFGTASTIAAWYFCKNPRVSSLVIWIATLAALAIINKNFYALLVIPLVYASQYVRLPVPRSGLVFYLFYPVHLAAIWITQAIIR